MTKEQFLKSVRSMATLAEMPLQDPIALWLNHQVSVEFTEHDPEIGRRLDKLRADAQELFEYCRGRVG
jgi:hypothetical protein